MIYPESAMRVAKTPADYTNSPYAPENGGYEYVLGYEACRKQSQLALEQNTFEALLPLVHDKETPASAQKGPGLYIEGFNDCLKRICSAYTQNQ